MDKQCFQSAHELMFSEIAHYCAVYAHVGYFRKPKGF